MLTGEAMVIGIIGGGTMGRGIAQICAAAGHSVRCYDSAPGASRNAINQVAAMFATLAEKGKMPRDAASTAASRLEFCDNLDELAGCEIVIEAVVEDLKIKRDLFAALEPIVGEMTILATNTSSLTVADIASGCMSPSRVAGLHFFNPVPLMRVVEVIAAVRTSTDTVTRLVDFVMTTGHRAVVASDQPGFLVNHAGRGLYTEGLRLLEEHVCEAAEVDLLLREAAGFRMGPLELLDLTGLDVSGRVMASIYEQFNQEPRFRPSTLVPPRTAAGLFGRKSGEGWYRYIDGQQQRPAAQTVPEIDTDLTVWVDPLADDMTAIAICIEAAGMRLVSNAEPDSLLLIQPWGIDATTAACDAGLDPARCVAIDPLPGLNRHRTLMLTAVTQPLYRDAAHALFSFGGGSATVISDSPGFVVQRVLAMIVNIAAEIAQRRIATVSDIDDAVKLGLGYPSGPLAWGDEIGLTRILAILAGISRCTSDPRYRPSAWLRRRAQLGLSLTTPNAARHD